MCFSRAWSFRPHPPIFCPSCSCSPHPGALLFADDPAKRANTDKEHEKHRGGQGRSQNVVLLCSPAANSRSRGVSCRLPCVLPGQLLVSSRPVWSSCTGRLSSHALTVVCTTTPRPQLVLWRPRLARPRPPLAPQRPTCPVTSAAHLAPPNARHRPVIPSIPLTVVLTIHQPRCVCLSFHHSRNRRSPRSACRSSPPACRPSRPLLVPSLVQPCHTRCSSRHAPHITHLLALLRSLLVLPPIRHSSCHTPSAARLVAIVAHRAQSFALPVPAATCPTP